MLYCQFGQFCRYCYKNDKIDTIDKITGGMGDEWRGFEITDYTKLTYFI